MANQRRRVRDRARHTTYNKEIEIQQIASECFAKLCTVATTHTSTKSPCPKIYSSHPIRKWGAGKKSAPPCMWMKERKASVSKPYRERERDTEISKTKMQRVWKEGASLARMRYFPIFFSCIRSPSLEHTRIRNCSIH